MTQPILDDLKTIGEQNQFESICKRLKSSFRYYFTGYCDWEGFEIGAAKDLANLDEFQIHGFDFEEFCDEKTGNIVIRMTVILGRPGLLIGQGGNRIDALAKHLSEELGQPVVFGITELDIWK